MKNDYIRNRIRSFKHAFNGFGIALSEEPHAMIHMMATILVVAMAVLFRCSPMEWTVLGLSMGAVWCAELMNTSIERLANKVSPGYDELIGQVKDLSAAAVLLMSVGAVVAGLAIFLPKIIGYFL